MPAAVHLGDRESITSFDGSLAQVRLQLLRGKGGRYWRISNEGRQVVLRTVV
jgi:hypothetical protein